MMSSQVCIDANLLISALTPSPMSRHALALFARWRRDDTNLIAPALLAFEVTSSLRRLVYLEAITEAEGDEAFAAYQRIGLRLSHRAAIFPLAWQLAKQFGRPRAYDTAYLALAQLEGCDFWTADQRLYNTVQRELPWVHQITEAANLLLGSTASSRT